MISIISDTIKIDIDIAKKVRKLMESTFQILRICRIDNIEDIAKENDEIPKMKYKAIINNSIGKPTLQAFFEVLKRRIFVTKNLVASSLDTRNNKRSLCY
ncbi:hypothetical protein [Salinicoccus albus]|uniref:hypothetical protein n=1 Tax=Salinicoccus albus TaxID=418756 RepID=UPI000375BE80|nr:hypothetical protein [Salinicoccus albus]